MKKSKSNKKEKKTKTPKQKKTTKQKKYPKINKYHKNTYETKTISQFIPSTTSINQSTSSIPHTMSQAGIPYTSTLESFGISNKPPYFLDSLIAKSSPMAYAIPVPSTTSSTLTGGNTMTKTKPKAFEEQTKSQNIDYVDLVEPYKNGNKELQPDYILLNEKPVSSNDNMKPVLDMKIRKRRIKKEMMETKNMTKEMNKPTPKPSQNIKEKTKNSNETKKEIEEKIKKSKEMETRRNSLRGYL